MREALIAGGFLVIAAIIGSFIKPGEDQLRPLTPQASSLEPADHGHHH